MNFKLWPKSVKRKAKAHMRGGPLAPGIKGIVIFEDVPRGTKVSVDIVDFTTIPKS